MNWEVVGAIAGVVGARGVLELPLGRAWWDQEVMAGVFSREFISVISEAAAPCAKVKLAGFEG